MTLDELYLDNQVTGYIVFKSLSKQKILELSQYLYKGKLPINEDELQKKGSCLAMPFHHNFEDIFHILAMYTNDVKTTNHNFHASLRIPVEMSYRYTRIPTILFGTTQTSKSFIIVSNIRDSQTVLDIYFQDGQSYYCIKNEVYELNEKNLFSKYYKKFDLNFISDF
ncbi:hypothetical protein NMU03_08750 [Allocoprobacillus halotolerans]|uniref:Uncharacterized protein n=1 Tax=Allocoprobacillus halotolerans TaxID=2944914 RepID=A0ABY5HXM4_9FIRM|nr:hypothetical protein [Allocoprobacillus halotolerans]UTY37819.1 hypothetical protein NMU03_08750 [Allocoprobacillus halotolerans]